MSEAVRSLHDSKSEVSDFLRDREINTIRLEATNHDGALIGKNVSPSKLRSGLTSGFAFADVAFGLDLGNLPQFGFAYPQWRGNLPDVFLRIDPSTLVEWSRGRASVMGDFWLPDGSPLPVCPRNLLRRMTEKLATLGYEAKVAVEIEATVFEESIHVARSRKYRDLTPLGGSAGFAYHVARSKDWDDYMLAVARRFDELGIEWDVWNDEAASGQVEVNLVAGSPMSVCDSWARARQVMREVAHEYGHSVTFMAKPTEEAGQASHLNLSLQRDGVNLFYQDAGPSPIMRQAIGGLMATLPGATSIALPQITSYRRLVSLTGPPVTVSWGVDNKTTAVRAVVGHPAYSRLEHRLPGADANLYLVAATILAGIIAGLTHELEPPAEVTDMAWCLPDGLPPIPPTMSKAADALSHDQLLAETLGAEFVDYWVGTRRWEWMQFHTNGGDPSVELSEWESLRYFELP